MTRASSIPQPWARSGRSAISNWTVFIALDQRTDIVQDIVIGWIIGQYAGERGLVNSATDIEVCLCEGLIPVQHADGEVSHHSFGSDVEEKFLARCGGQGNIHADGGLSAGAVFVGGLHARVHIRPLVFDGHMDGQPFVGLAKAAKSRSRRDRDGGLTLRPNFISRPCERTGRTALQQKGFSEQNRYPSPSSIC